MAEYAVRAGSKRGPIVNFITTDGGLAAAEAALERMEGNLVLDPYPSIADIRAYELDQLWEVENGS